MFGGGGSGMNGMQVDPDIIFNMMNGAGGGGFSGFSGGSGFSFTDRSRGRGGFSSHGFHFS